MRDESTMERAQGGLFATEHSLAWLMAIAAIVLGVLGLLTGFDILNLRSGEGAEGPGGLPANFLDGTMLIFSGITAGMLAYTLHSSDHHRMRGMMTAGKADKATSAAEHSMAYLMALGTIALVVIGLLVGYGVFDVENPQLDGLLWIWTGFGGSILSATLHSVRHHVSETDEIVAIVTERVREGPIVGEPQTRTTQTRTTR